MNQDLRAAYRILSLLEKSKAFSDRIFDSLPGVYVMVDSAGTILRSNRGTASLLDMDAEDVPGNSAGRLLGENGLEELLKRIRSIACGDVERADFETPVAAGSATERSFHWEVNRLPLEKAGSSAMFSLIGRDVSELKKAIKLAWAFEKDLDFAKAAQSLLLPSIDSDATSDWEMAAYYEPAAQAGGDWWRLEKRPDGSALFLLGDVTGHGVGAGMVTAMVAGGYAAFTARNGTGDVKGVFHEIHRQLMELRGRSYWMTLFALDVRPDANEVIWYSAAAPSAILAKESGEITELGGPGRPLGSGALAISEGRTGFEPGDRLLCATDGLFEVSPEISTSMLKRRYASVLRATIDEGAVRARERVIEERRKWAGFKELEDDVAFLVIDRLGARQQRRG